MENGSNTDIKTKNPKQLKLIVIVCAAVALIAAGILTAVFAGDYIVNNFMLATKSDAEYFKWLAGRYADMGREAVTADVKDRAELAKKLKDGIKCDTTVETFISDDMCEKLDIYNISDIRLKLGTLVSPESTELTALFGYGGVDVISIEAALDSADGSLYLAVPSYKPELIDATPLLESYKLSNDERSARELIDEVMGEVLEAVSGVSDMTAEEAGQSYESRVSFVLDGIEDVTVTKKATIERDETVLKFNMVTVKLSGSELFSIIEKVSDGDVSQLKDYASKADAVVSFYVDGRGRILGGDAELSYKETKISAELIIDGSSDNFAADTVVRVNSIKAADMRLEVQTGEDKVRRTMMDIVPGAMVDSFLGKGDYRLVLSVNQSDEHASMSAELTSSGTRMFRAAIDTSVSAYDGKHLVSLGDRVVVPYESVVSEYFEVGSLLEYVMNLYDSLKDDETFKEVMNSLCAMLFGEGIDFETVKSYYDMGFFGGGDTGSSSSGASSEASSEASSADGGDTDETDSTDELGEELNPEEDDSSVAEPPVQQAWDYPEASKTYYFSHANMAEYAQSVEYKGLEYQVPAPSEITAQDFEEAKENFLAVNSYISGMNQADMSVQDGDGVTLDIVPLVMGFPIETYAFYDCYAQVGEDWYGDGLDEQLIGMTIGETKDIPAVLNEQYGEFEGYEGTFRVTIKDIDRYVAAEWSEAFIVDVLGYESLDACSDEIMSILTESRTMTEEEIAYELLSMVKQSFTMTDIPEEVYSSVWDEYYNSMYLVTYDMSQQTPEEYFYGMDYSEAEFEEMMNAGAQEALEDYVLYAYIAEQENLSLPGTEVLSLVADYMEYFTCESYDELMSIFSLDKIIDYEIESRISAIIYESAQITYEK